MSDWIVIECQPYVKENYVHICATWNTDDFKNTSSTHTIVKMHINIIFNYSFLLPPILLYEFEDNGFKINVDMSHFHLYSVFQGGNIKVSLRFNINRVS